MAICAAILLLCVGYVEVGFHYGDGIRLPNAVPTDDAWSTGRVVSQNSWTLIVFDPAPVGRRYISHGNLMIENMDPAQDGVLTDVRLVGGDGHLSVQEAFIVPTGSDQDDTWLFGAGFRLPPDPSDDSPLSDNQQEKWAARVPLRGYRIPPGTLVNALILIKVDDACDGGKSERIEFDYSQGGRLERLASPTRIEVSPIGLQSSPDRFLACQSGRHRFSRFGGSLAGFSSEDENTPPQ